MRPFRFSHSSSSPNHHSHDADSPLIEAAETSWTAWKRVNRGPEGNIGGDIPGRQAASAAPEQETGGPGIVEGLVIIHFARNAPLGANRGGRPDRKRLEPPVLVSGDKSWMAPSSIMRGGMVSH